MSGPRVTTGLDSKQDYGTPDDLMEAVNARIGTVVFDLAAHAHNTKHARYFAPRYLTITLDEFDEESQARTADKLVLMGALGMESVLAVKMACDMRSPKEKKVTVSVKNEDTKAFGYDALDPIWNWGVVGVKASKLADVPDGLLWLNCEFNDVATWAARCKEEGKRGARIALLTPAMVGSNWHRDLIAGHADVYYLNGRVTFDGKNPYPKDCMISVYGPGSKGRRLNWDWKRNVITHQWEMTMMESLRGQP